jgi:hypothetical protein
MPQKVKPKLRSKVAPGWEYFSTKGMLEQVAGAACCDSGNTTCAAGLSCITGYCDIKRISAKRKLTTDRLKNNHIIHFNL